MRNPFSPIFDNASPPRNAISAVRDEIFGIESDALREIPARSGDFLPMTRCRLTFGRSCEQRQHDKALK
jgi:hypothetical protein